MLETVCKNCNQRYQLGTDHVCQKAPEKKLSGGSSAVERKASNLGVEGSTPSRRSKKSTAARKDVHVGKMAAGDGAHSPSEASAPPETLGNASAKPAGTQAPPVDTKPKRGRGRPQSITDMRVYKAMKAREYRAKQKAKADD